MNRMIGIIFAALTLFAVMGINPNSATAAPGEEFICDPTRLQINNFISCGTCGSCPADDMAEVRVRGELNKEALLKLSEELNRARVAKTALRNKADKSVVDALERRIADLESRGNGLCGGLKQDVHITLCLATIRAGTIDMQQNLLKLLGSAFEAEIPHDFMLVQGAGPLTPTLFVHSKTPTEEIPAFAKSRRDTPRPVAETEPLGFLVPVLGGCAIGAAGGWGLADGLEVDFDEDTLDEGKGAKGAAVGCAIGAAGGAIFTWAYNSSLGDD